MAANFRYADYWFDQENYAQADTFFEATLQAIKLHNPSERFNPSERYNQSWSQYKKQLTNQMLSKIHNRNSYLNNPDLSN